jgi:hypothetical protein
MESTTLEVVRHIMSDESLSESQAQYLSGFEPIRNHLSLLKIQSNAERPANPTLTRLGLDPVQITLVEAQLAARKQIRREMTDKKSIMAVKQRKEREALAAEETGKLAKFDHPLVKIIEAGASVLPMDALMRIAMADSKGAREATKREELVKWQQREVVSLEDSRQQVLQAEDTPTLPLPVLAVQARN